jgi:hypothetical protein
MGVLQKVTPIALCFGLIACAAGGASNASHEVLEGTVDIPDRGTSRPFNVRLSQAEPKINVRMPLTGDITLTIFGTVGLANVPEPAAFEKAAGTYLNARKGRGCTLKQPVQIAKTEWEFEYECPAPLS